MLCVCGVCKSFKRIVCLHAMCSVVRLCRICLWFPNCLYCVNGSLNLSLWDCSETSNACYHSVQNLLSASLLSKNIKINIHRNIILPIFLYIWETWSLTLAKERRLMVSEVMVLRGIFGTERVELTGEWRKLHYEELNDLYCSPNIVIKSRRMR